MKKYFKLRYAALSFVKGPALRLIGVKLLGSLALSCAAIGIVPLLVSQAQRLYMPVRVSNVSAQVSGSGTVVSILADGSLARAQTWQDNEGFHVVLPSTVAADSLKTARGLKVRRVGSSLEVLLQTKPGVRVSVQSDGNHLSLLVDGKLETRSFDFDSRPESNSSEERRLFEDPQFSNLGRQDSAPLRVSPTVEDSSSRTTGTENNPAANFSNSTTVPGQAPHRTNADQIVPQQDGSRVPDTPPSEIKIQPEDDGLLASLFSGTSVLVVFALGLLGLLVSRKLRSRRSLPKTGETSSSSETGWKEGELSEETKGQPRSAHATDVSTSLVKGGESVPTNGSSRQAVVRLPVAGPISLYGAYRIDQEVGKLILGQPHRIDVLASRASEDRRAIETSLIKGINSPELDENARRRAREALEEYGFMARQCASLLLAPDAFDRTSAARSLGEIKSPAALPFLLEGLYDSESIVRNQAVVSIGELKLPSAIGALLDIARMHPDVPSALLSRALSACSVEGLDFFDAVVSEPALLGSGHDGGIIEQITEINPASPVEDLPEGSDDERLAQALESLESSDLEERSEALNTLVQFRVQSSVGAIALVARHDHEPNIRAHAISALGSINHESVFATILMGMADETREVRAAAARSLNRLSFDRADAYVRVIESNDEETIQNVAKACIHAGIVSQNLDRLAHSDYRQAYETFSLVCLLAKAKMNETVLDAIADHPDIDVRLNAVHLLACTGQPEVFEQLRQLAVKDGMREEVKTALLEAMYKLDQSKKEREALENSAVDSEPLLEAPEEETAEAHFEPEFEKRFEPEFERELEPTFEPEFEAEVQPKDELEL